MSEAPNPADFCVNDRPREYSVRFDVRGEIHLTIEADSLEAARAQAQAMVEADDFGLELDEVTHADIAALYKSRSMFFVTRDGCSVQVSHLLPGDVPRKPSERGF